MNGTINRDFRHWIDTIKRTIGNGNNQKTALAASCKGSPSIGRSVMKIEFTVLG